MSEKIKVPQPVARAEWKRPEIRQLVAGHAETAFTTGSDGATQS